MVVDGRALRVRHSCIHLSSSFDVWIVSMQIVSRRLDPSTKGLLCQAGASCCLALMGTAVKLAGQVSPQTREQQLA